MASPLYVDSTASNTKNKKMAASHSRSQKNNSDKTKRSRQQALPVAFVNPSSGTFHGNKKLVESGSDTVFIMEQTDTTYYPTGHVYYETIITTELTERLSNVCKNYQRVKWRYLNFTFEGSWTTMATGGFTAAFIPDPADKIPENYSGIKKLTWLTARDHTRDSKWYGNTKLNVKPVQDLLWTSMGSDEEPRLYSPGSIVVMGRGGPGQAGTLTIRLDWSVELSQPSTEEETVVAQPFLLKESFSVMPDTHTDKYLTCALTRITPNVYENPLETEHVPITPEDIGLVNAKHQDTYRLPKPFTLLATYLENSITHVLPVHIDHLMVVKDVDVARGSALENEVVHQDVIALAYWAGNRVARLDFNKAAEDKAWISVFGPVGHVVTAGTVLEKVDTSIAPEMLHIQTHRGVISKPTGRKIVLDTKKDVFPYVKIAGNTSNSDDDVKTLVGEIDTTLKSMKRVQSNGEVVMAVAEALSGSSGSDILALLRSLTCKDDNNRSHLRSYVANNSYRDNIDAKVSVVSEVSNFPPVQIVNGMVGVNNFPDTQKILGTVDVSHMPSMPVNFPDTVFVKNAPDSSLEVKAYEDDPLFVSIPTRSYLPVLDVKPEFGPRNNRNVNDRPFNGVPAWGLHNGVDPAPMHTLQVDPVRSVLVGTRKQDADEIMFGSSGTGHDTYYEAQCDKDMGQATCLHVL